jgi:hypothetical protein
LAGSDDIARLGPVSFAGVQDTGCDTGDYAAGEIQAMAQRIAAEIAAAVWPVQDEKEDDNQTLHGHSIGGDDDVIE